MPTRRVPKGPGRRPKSLARKRFLELMAQGWPAAAAREVGVSRSTAHIWRHGTTVRRKDGTVKILAPLQPLASRTISARFLSEPERLQIADLASKGAGPRAIAAVLGRSPSTISRELRRNAYPGAVPASSCPQSGCGAAQPPKPLKVSASTRSCTPTDRTDMAVSVIAPSAQR